MVPGEKGGKGLGAWGLLHGAVETTQYRATEPTRGLVHMQSEARVVVGY